ncbi:tripeptidyl-peptidase II Tpp2 [Branchiostoma belcheri]|nr:tripeptidyl-peptidase II Tpp2 [Branchiostoma belcheri]
MACRRLTGCTLRRSPITHPISPAFLTGFTGVKASDLAHSRACLRLYRNLLLFVLGADTGLLRIFQFAGKAVFSFRADWSSVEHGWAVCFIADNFSRRVEEEASIRELKRILKDPSHPCHTFIHPTEEPRYELRRRSQYKLPISRTDRHENSFVARAIKDLQNLG